MINTLAQIKTRFRMRQLRLLFILAEEGSLRKTAERMSITQPAATKGLQELETLLGESLFIRSPQGLIPNELGKAAIRYAQLVFADLDSLHEEMTAIESGHLGTIHLGAMSSLAGTLLPKVIARIKSSFPKLNVSVTISTSDVLLHALNRDQLDLLVARIPQDYVQENLDFERFGSEHLQIVAGRNHPQRQNAAISLADLAAYPWIVHPPATPLREIFTQIFRDAELNAPVNLVETSSMTLSASLLDQTDMLTIMSLSFVEYYQGFGLLKPLPVSLSCSLPNYGLIRRKNRPITPSMRLVCDMLRDEAHLLS